MNDIMFLLVLSMEFVCREREMCTGSVLDTSVLAVSVAQLLQFEVRQTATPERERGVGVGEMLDG